MTECVPIVLQSRDTRIAISWSALAAVGCALFGLVFLLNVHSVGDGVWFWYATGLQNGHKLYRDLHVPMQPLFILITEWNQRLLGTSWLASKVPAVMQDVLYSCGLYLVARRVPWPDWQRALLVAATFGLTIMAFYYRFDDYHITGHCFTVFSILLCLNVQREGDAKRVLRLAVLLGVLAGLAIANRINDGALLAVASAAALFVFAWRARVAAVLLFTLTTCAVFLGLLLLTGDSLAVWANETIFRAAGVKGGLGHILFAPLHFPAATFLHIKHDRLETFHVAALTVAIGATTAGIVRLSRRDLRSRRTAGTVLLLLGLAAMPGLAVGVYGGHSMIAVADLLILACYAIALVFLVRFLILLVRADVRTWDRQEVLLLFPFGQIIAGAMTSGQSFLEAYPPLAMLLLLSPLIFPALSTVRVARQANAILLAVITVGTFSAKAVHPYFWHHFDNGSLLTGRTWYNHPQYGPMYLERGQLQMMTSLCSVVHTEGGAHTDMLAMPWPYANYFCSVAPWHGYVQTWYDTTSRVTAAKLQSDLETQPPEWIVYQRALDSMWVHEKIFLNGVRLPHRSLDALIMDRVLSGAWTVRWQRCYSSADWLLIHTRPAAAGEPHEMPIPTTERVNLCSRTGHEFLR